MRIGTLFGLYAIVTSVILIALGGLTLWTLERTQWWDERIRLAQESYARHLELQSHVYQLLKQHGDGLLIGDRDKGAGERRLREQIAGDIEDIRNIIAAEITLVGEEEIEELAMLARIESDVRSITRALSLMTEGGVPVDKAEGVARLTDLLDREIDIHLSGLIGAALAEEREEVEETQVEAAAFRRANRIAVIALAAAASSVLVLMIGSFLRLVRRPLTALDKGLNALREERYDVELDVGGIQEFAVLSGVLNEMAAGLRRREATREEQERALQETVDNRTQELQSLLRRLETTERNRSQLMADISHELRTPLAIIQGEAEVSLRSGIQSPDQISDTLARIRDSARHTNKIVDDMLLVARQEAGKLRLDRRETDLRQVVREAIGMFASPVEFDDATPPVMASVDPLRLRQSLLAVFQNAGRYGGPNIAVRLRATPKGAVIEIEDDGPGMSDADMAQAFERFFRGNNASHEGTGLGLPIVRSILHAHGGDALLARAASGGLLVVLRLPIKPVLTVIDGEPARFSRSAS